MSAGTPSFCANCSKHDACRHERGAAPVALGKSIGGEPIVVDLARMPHLLVAGTTGSGKSVGVNALILSLLYRQSPEECRFLMIDPKMLELSVYNGIPHLLTPVVTDPHQAAAALEWVVSRDGGALQAHVASSVCATSRCSISRVQERARSAARSWRAPSRPDSTAESEPAGVRERAARLRRRCRLSSSSSTSSRT